MFPFEETAEAYRFMLQATSWQGRDHL